MKGISRKEMERVLKADCVPYLKSAGFKGSFPNFYRDTNNFIALINFQFYSGGGSFCVNLSFADPERANISFRPETKINQLKVSQARERLRLGSNNGGDSWYSFGETNYGEFRGNPTPPSEIASKINHLLSSDAEYWWKIKSDT